MHWSKQTSGGFLRDAPKLLILSCDGRKNHRPANHTWRDDFPSFSWRKIYSWQVSQCCIILWKGCHRKDFLLHLGHVEMHIACTFLSLVGWFSHHTNFMGQRPSSHHGWILLSSFVNPSCIIRNFWATSRLRQFESTNDSAPTSSGDSASNARPPGIFWQKNCILWNMEIVW